MCEVVIVHVYMYLVCSEGDRKWFMDAMEAQTVDAIKRMKEITLVMKTPEEQLEAQGVTAAELVGNIWCDNSRCYSLILLCLSSPDTCSVA